VSIAVLDYGMGNLHSVSRAIAHVGGAPEITDDARRVAAADALVVPGVGAFGACVRALRERELDAAVCEFAAGERPLFGVCLGMQVLFEESEEDADSGLGVLAGVVRRLPATVKVPHMGWNTVGWSKRHRFVDGIDGDARFYFVHSYAVGADADSAVGVTEHGRAFASVVAAGSIFATQFHPEKSGDAGLAIYERFVNEAAA
jgi:imidazole glycerol-phosphate synthase subunit HisH